MRELQKKNVKTGLIKRLRPLLARAPYAHCGELLLSVSGGMDSMVLLDVMIRTAHVHGSPLRVLHVHHHTGPHADDACNLVIQYCNRYKIPLHLEHFYWDGSGNFEYEASSFRREVLASERKEHGWAVLAHHLRDQAETLIQTLARGAGTATPMGMAPERDRRLRPFLDVDHTLLENHARRAVVPFISDPTNEDRDRFRNAVRHEILPVLNAFHGRSEERLGQWAEGYRRLQEGLAADARSLFSAHYRHGLLKREVFSACSAYLWDHVFTAFWEANKMAKPQSKEHRRLISWLQEDRCGVFDHGGSRCFCDLDGVIMYPASPAKARNYRFGETVPWGSGTLFIELVGTDFTDAPTARLSPAANHSVSRKIRDRLREASVPHRIRESLPMLILDGRTHHYLELLSLEQRDQLRIRLITGPDTEPIQFPRPRLPRLEPI